MRKFIAGATVAGTLIALPLSAQASGGSSLGPINFESYSLGNINGQNGWTKTGPYDVEVASVGTFPSAAGYGFGTKALRLSNATTSGSFGDQTFSPGVLPAGESTGVNHFDASFSIGSTQPAEQSGLYTSVSPDDGQGGRMSYLRFEDQPGGIDVYFDDVQAGNFTDDVIATLTYGQAHTVKFAIDFVPGASNDLVKITIDGVVRAIGTTWEEYYRHDPEQAGNGNVVPTTSKLLFREGGADGLTHPANQGKGYLVDNVALSSSNNSSTNNCGTQPGFTYANVTVPTGAVCTLNNNTVTNDVNVQKGGTLLVFHSSIGHNLKADHPQGIGIYYQSSVGNDLNVDGVTGGSPDGFNYICYTSVGHDLNVVNSAATASPWSIGGYSDCGRGNSVGHDLNVNKNATFVDVARNTVTNNMSVTGNTGGANVQENSAGHDANCGGNNPPAVLANNSAPHKNTCA